METKGRVYLTSLGCDKNRADAEEMLGILAREGFTITDDETQAEIILVNTCCFIGDAKEESIRTILELSRNKKEGACRVLAVSGCLAQRYREEIKAELPEVDALIGTTAYEDLAKVLERACENGFSESFRDADYLPEDRVPRRLTTGGYFAYLKIAEGCDKNCTYCIIPKVRGHYRSIPLERLAAQARAYAAGGVRELILVAQETTLYGTDLYGRKMLHQLLRELCAIEPLMWIRILYCYPEEIYPELLEVIREEPKVCHYLDLPIQHADDEVLKRMGRRTDSQQLRQIIRDIRQAVPDIVLRTTLISGFPGETEEQHRRLLDFVREMQFDRLGVFAYSQEEDTPAAAMDGQIPEEEKERRRDELMALQQQISLQKGRERIGQVLPAMIEGYLPEDDTYVARTYADAPDVDGLLFVHAEQSLPSGTFIRVRITAATEYDVIGEWIDEYAE